MVTIESAPISLPAAQIDGVFILTKRVQLFSASSDVRAYFRELSGEENRAFAASADLRSTFCSKVVAGNAVENFAWI